ncbi:vacuolar protein sorting-associated protein 52 homolog [Frankliniella occidentalis]|uniref:Vacuolar protein sorting-associated protein 52 homolog n=1 Tax=Frankliniella occidentalis TaxID=133901 RepID=A0A6J1TJE7_FRAOC|nr:vacuolar protein sorting-associated protein 52 homolog [Frankliniella occidentalis]
MLGKRVIDDEPDYTLEDEVVQEVLKEGTDLRQYSHQIELELREVENQAIKDYTKESTNIAHLHNQITGCDTILERMETMLLGFQSDLGSISTEILCLQKKSIDMSQKLQNRQAVRAPIAQFINDLAVSEALIIGIVEEPVAEKEFLSQLKVLNQKINFMKEQTFKDTRSSQDVRDIVEKLKLKAIAKIRSYLLEQISKFRKPNANFQVPQNNMLKFKFFFEFIMTNERNVAEEICAEYIDTMSKIYYTYFKAYSSRVSKLQFEEHASRDDLMGIEETGSRGLFYKTPLKNKSTVFTIGSRGDVLSPEGLEAPIIVPHAAQKCDARYPFEALFRSEQFALVDNSCREYLFICEFFMMGGSAAMEFFDQVMGKTLGLLVKNLDTYAQDCYDTIALFLSVHIILRYQLLCHKRAVPALDQYFDSLQSIIWPRFEFVFQQNIQSVRDCDPTKFGKEMRPHAITRRYAEYSAAILGISENFPNDLVTRLLAELQEEVELFILRMAAIFQLRKEQLIFLINNYDMVLSVLTERTRENSKEGECFRELLSSRSSEYVEEILSPHFGGLMQFVKEGEALVEKNQAEELKKQEKKSLALVQAFNSNWKRSLEDLNKEVLTSFSNLVTASSLLQLALTQLVHYYHRFHKLLSSSGRAQLTNIHHIMVEVKKYKTCFS